MKIEELSDKIKGCLTGGAIGDALGYPVEFTMSYDGIVANYGEGGIEEYELSYGEALISDDTQMTLYTAEAIIEAKNTCVDIVPEVCKAYLLWFGAQTGKKIKTVYNSELTKIAKFNQRRAPGNTCLSALQAIYSGREPLNNSKGCGGIMRVAPVGIYGAVRNH